MKNTIYFFTLSLFFTTSMLMSSEIVYRRATAHDVPAIVDLINNHARADSDKIVILPERFRRDAIESAVSKGRIFVAAHSASSEIIGFKKLFCLTDEKELKETLTDELLCINTMHVDSATLAITGKQSGTVTEHATTSHAHNATTYIYNGGDYTHPSYRNRKVNHELMRLALATIQPTILQAAQAQKSSNLALVYGLVQANAGNAAMEGRTLGIARVFAPFTQTIAAALQCDQPATLTCRRYRAFMPTFDQKSLECRPLPDSQSIPGYGCVLACSLLPQSASTQPYHSHTNDKE